MSSALHALEPNDLRGQDAYFDQVEEDFSGEQARNFHCFHNSSVGLLSGMKEGGSARKDHKFRCPNLLNTGRKHVGVCLRVIAEADIAL